MVQQQAVNPNYDDDGSFLSSLYDDEEDDEDNGYWPSAQNLQDIQDVKNNKAIEVSWRCEDLDDYGLQPLAKALHGNSSLESLVLFDNKISPIGAKSIANSIACSPASRLKYLNLGHNKLHDEGVISVVETVLVHPFITELFLDSNSFGLPAVERIAELITENKNIKFLSLNINNIGDDGIKLLAKAMEESSIEYFNVCHCQIESEGAKALATSLARNASLKTLLLRGNFINDEGITAIARQVLGTSRHPLQRIDLGDTGIGDAGVIEVGNALIANDESSLQNLHLGFNGISDDGITTIADALRQDTSPLQRLCLNNNALSDDGAKLLSQALAHNTKLHELDLTSNDRIGKIGTVAITQALVMSLFIKRVYLVPHMPKDILREASVFTTTIQQAFQMNSSESFFRISSFSNWKASARTRDKKTNRLPLHQGIEDGLSWENVISCLLKAYPAAILEKDEVTGLDPFMLAATTKTRKTSTPTDDLTTIYELLRFNPMSLISFVQDTNS